MNAELRAILDAHDDAEGAEVPGDNWEAFPYDDLTKSIDAIAQALHDELDLRFKRDSNVQDASYLDDLYIRHPHTVRRDGMHLTLSEIVLRFSNFGRLFTAFSTMPAMPEHYPVERIIALVERHGWIYVPAEELEVEVYDGKHAGLRNGRTTWWTRFFDYL